MGARLWYSYPDYYRKRWLNAAHRGKYYKRRLNKLRRKYWDADPRHTRGLVSQESEVSYRGL